MANNELKSMYKSMGIPEAVYDYCDGIWESLKTRFEKIKEISDYNQAKVLKAMQDNKVSEACLLGTTGYG